MPIFNPLRKSARSWPGLKADEDDASGMQEVKVPLKQQSSRRTSLTDPFACIDENDARVKSDAFREALNKHYPGALDYEESAVAVKAVLRQYGFTAHTSIALVAQCRDEITKPFTTAIEHNWLGSFNIGSLAGTVFCGTTGFTAALHHAPQDEATGLERIVVFCGPHIAIDENGVVGSVRRFGRRNASSACGALIAFENELKQGKLEMDDKPFDIEFCNLKRRLLRGLKFGDRAPSLVDLTQVCLDASVDDVREILARILPANSAHAIVSGVLIHGPDGSHYFWPGTVQVTTEAGSTVQLREALVGSSRVDYRQEMLRYLASKVEAAGLVCEQCVQPTEGDSYAETDVSSSSTPSGQGTRRSSQSRSSSAVLGLTALEA